MAYQLATRLLAHESAQRGFGLSATQDVHFTEVRLGGGRTGGVGGGPSGNLGAGGALPTPAFGELPADMRPL